MEAVDLAAELGICVYFDSVLYRSDIFLAIPFQQAIRSTIDQNVGNLRVPSIQQYPFNLGEIRNKCFRGRVAVFCVPLAYEPALDSARRLISHVLRSLLNPRQQIFNFYANFRHPIKTCSWFKSFPMFIYSNIFICRQRNKFNSLRYIR